MVFYTYTALILLYLLSVFWEIPLLQYAVGIVATFALFLAIQRAKGLYFYSGLVFLTVGIILFFIQGAPWQDLLLSFDTMLGFMALFFVLPFLNTIIKVGRYDRHLSILLKTDITRLDQLYQRSFLVTHVLGIFLNVAMLPLLKQSLQHPLQQLTKERANQFLSRNLLRSLSLCLSWSPLEILVIISLDMTGYTYFDILLPMAGIVAFIISLDFLINFYSNRKIGLTMSEKQNSKEIKIGRKLLFMAFMLVVFVCLTTVFQQFTQKGFLLSVVVVIIPYSILWAMLIKRPKRYFTVTIPHWKEKTEGLSNYIFMFLSASLFVGMLTRSGAISYLQTPFMEASQHSLLLYFLIGCYFFIAAIFGFHSLVSFALLGEILGPILPDISSISLAIVFIVCSISTIMYSPFSLSGTVMSELLRINPFNMLRWNYRFAWVYMAVSIFVAYGISLFT